MTTTDLREALLRAYIDRLGPVRLPVRVLGPATPVQPVHGPHSGRNHA
jgi:hypothetical protein